MTLSRILCDQLRGETRGSQTHQQLTDSRVWPEYLVPRPSDQDPVTMLHTQNSPPRFYYFNFTSEAEVTYNPPPPTSQTRVDGAKHTPETILVRYRYINYIIVLIVHYYFTVFFRRTEKFNFAMNKKCGWSILLLLTLPVLIYGSQFAADN